MTAGAGPGEIVAVPRHEVDALCTAALHTVGARRRVAELLTGAALFAEDRGKGVVAELRRCAEPIAGRAAPTIES
jgi:hypothetical protein